MRWIVMVALLGGCADTADSSADGCAGGHATFLAPALDEIVPPPAVDVRVMASPSSGAEVTLSSPEKRYYPTGDGQASGDPVLSFHFDGLPASTAFVVDVSRLCFSDVEDMFGTMVKLGSWRFSTGP